MAADGFDLLGDGGRGAAFGALEGHVFEEVAGAVLVGGFVAGAGGNIGAEGNGLDAVHALGDDGQARRQAGDADGFAVFGGFGHAAFLSTVARTAASMVARSAGRFV